MSCSRGQPDAHIFVAHRKHGRNRCVDFGRPFAGGVHNDSYVLDILIDERYDSTRSMALYVHLRHGGSWVRLVWAQTRDEDRAGSVI